MKKRLCIAIGLLVVAVMFFAACGTPDIQTIITSDAKKLISDIQNSDPSIKNVKVYYSTQSYAPPFLSFDVYVTDQPTDDVVQSILDRVKKYMTVDAAKGINGDGNMDVYFNVYLEKSKKEPYIQYTTAYYKTNDHTNDSPDTINGFKNWLKTK